MHIICDGSLIGWRCVSLKKRECQYRAKCNGWSWAGPYAFPRYACYLIDSVLDWDAKKPHFFLIDSAFFISGPKHCQNLGANIDSDGHEAISGTCFYKSRLIGYDDGKYFDDLEELNLAQHEAPITKMVFWRYTCSRPCLGTEDIPGRNGHITSFITRYGHVKSGFHGYPLLGGTRTAMRSFFNFTETDDDWSNHEIIRQVRVPNLKCTTYAIANRKY